MIENRFSEGTPSLINQPANSNLTSSLAGFLRDEAVPDDYLLISINSQTDLGPKASKNLVNFQKHRTFYKFIPFIAYGLLLSLFIIIGGLGVGLKWFGGGILTSGILFTLAVVQLQEKPMKYLIKKIPLLATFFTSHRVCMPD